MGWKVQINELIGFFPCLDKNLLLTIDSEHLEQASISQSRTK